MAHRKIKKSEKIESEIDEKIKKLPEHIDKKIEEEIEKEIEKELVSDIGIKVRQKVDEAMGVVKFNDQRNGRVFSNLVFPVKFISGILGPCWRGDCRLIIIIVLVTYSMLGILMIYCQLATQSSICLQRNLLGASPLIILISVLSLLASFILAIFSNNQRGAFLLLFLIYLPVIVLMLVISIEYLGFIVLGAGIIFFLIQLIKR